MRSVYEMPFLVEARSLHERSNNAHATTEKKDGKKKIVSFRGRESVEVCGGRPRRADNARKIRAAFKKGTKKESILVPFSYWCTVKDARGPLLQISVFSVSFPFPLCASLSVKNNKRNPLCRLCMGYHMFLNACSQHSPLASKYSSMFTEKTRVFMIFWRRKK